MCVIEPSPILETRRLLLRAPAREDVDRIALLAGDWDVARMLGRVPHPYLPKHAEEFLALIEAMNPATDRVFAIELEDEGFIGMIGFHPLEPVPIRPSADRDEQTRRSYPERDSTAEPVSTSADRALGSETELGYWIGRPYWGRGLVSEAADAALAWVKRAWKRRHIVAGHFTDNPASGRVLCKAGFLYTGRIELRDSRARGEPVPTRMMVWLA